MKKSLLFFSFALSLINATIYGEEIQKAPQNAPVVSDLYVAEIINQGQQILLSDNTMYDIAPEDWVKTQGWITVTQIKVEPSDNPYFPYFLINTNTGTQVKARKVAQN